MMTNPPDGWQDVPTWQTYACLECGQTLAWPEFSDGLGAPVRIPGAAQADQGGDCRTCEIALRWDQDGEAPALADALERLANPDPDDEGRGWRWTGGDPIGYN